MSGELVLISIENNIFLHSQYYNVHACARTGGIT